MYKTFGKDVKYLHGVSDAGSKLLFKFRSGTHSLNEELGRHRGMEDKFWSVTVCCACVQLIVVVELVLR